MSDPNDGYSISDLEHRAVQRWVEQGSLMILVMVLAILSAMILSFGGDDPAAHWIVGVLVAVSAVAFGIFQVTRWRNRKTLNEIARRHANKHHGPR